MAWLALVDRVPGPEHFTRRSAYVQSVFVISPERSNGIGTSLMEFVLVHARELAIGLRRSASKRAVIPALPTPRVHGHRRCLGAAALAC